MDSYAQCVIALLDHLELSTAVIGGVSLGANVALQCAAQDPDRVQGMLLEMPVLEWAVPGAGLVFLPLLLGFHYASRLVGIMSALARRLPRTQSWVIEGLRAPIALRPEESTAVLHGLFVGPIAPTVEQRRVMTMPTLVIGHHADFIHPFSDAKNLEEQLPNARLLQAGSILELRLRPDRLMKEISSFLDDAWKPQLSAVARRQDLQ
jgi:pimeloyl-ACP methyl ester carboxylesterase